MYSDKTYSLYIHIPFCLSKCTYCDFFSIECHNNPPVSDSYITALIKEVDYRLGKLNKKCKSIYIGGGTPSLITEKQLDVLFQVLKNNLTFTDNYEFTLEMNPDDITKDKLDFLMDSPVTRISCGIQSLDDEVLKAVKRRASKAEVEKALSLLKTYWHKTLSLDLISSLPYEKEEKFLENLKTICSYKPDHISLYALTLEEETPLGKDVSKNIIPYDYEAADKMWLKGRNVLLGEGYFQYEVSNFCLKGKECIHNLTYWNHEDYFGIGSGASGTIYNQDGSGFRWTNTRDIKKYIDFWNGKTFVNPCDITNNGMEDSESIDVPVSKFEFFMMGLRKLSGVSERQYRRVFGEGISPSVVSLFSEWEKKKLALIQKKDDDIFYSLNAEGILFLNRFLEELEL